MLLFSIIIFPLSDLPLPNVLVRYGWLPWHCRLSFPVPVHRTPDERCAPSRLIPASAIEAHQHSHKFGVAGEISGFVKRFLNYLPNISQIGSLTLQSFYPSESPSDGRTDIPGRSSMYQEGSDTKTAMNGLSREEGARMREEIHPFFLG